MALRVIAVSISVSPFLIEDQATDMLMTSAPSRFAASSKDVRVRVEFSKKRLMTVRPSRRCFRSEEHTSELQSLMRISYAVFCLKKKNKNSVTAFANTYTHRTTK